MIAFHEVTAKIQAMCLSMGENHDKDRDREFNYGLKNNSKTGNKLLKVWRQL